MQQASFLRKTIAAFLGQVLTPEVAAAIERAATMNFSPATRLGDIEPVDATSEREGRKAFFARFLTTDAAIAFNLLMVEVLHLWDDLIDGDKAVSKSALNAAFRAMLVTLPKNEFYRLNFDELHPLIDNFILNWLTANDFERAGDEEMRRLAYVMRSDYISVFLRSVQIERGFGYAVQVAPEIRHHWHAEGWDGYLENLQIEQTNREDLKNVL